MVILVVTEAASGLPTTSRIGGGAGMIPSRRDTDRQKFVNYMDN